MKLKYILLLLSVALSCIQFTPMIWEGGIYSSFKLVIFLLLFLLTISCLVSYKKNIRPFYNYALIRIHLFAFIFLLYFLFVLYAMGAFVRFEPLYDLFIALLFLILSVNIKLSKNQFTYLLKTYLLFSFILGLSIVLYYAHGLYVSELYLPVPKNQIGPFLSIALLISLFLSELTSKRFYLITYFFLALTFFVFLLILRARANIVASLLGLLVYFFLYKKKIIYVILSFGLILLLLIFTSLGELLINSLFLNYDINDIDSISAGRVDTYKLGLDFLESNFFTGELFYGSIMSENTVHNYLLHKFVSYGILFSCPFLIVYLSYIYTMIRNNYCNAELKLYNIGSFMFIVPLVLSLFEYTYPFGPGMSLLFPYLCLGQYLINK